MSKKYSEFVMRLFKADEKQINMQLHAAVGIVGEAGELIDNVKKTWIYNKPQDVENIKEELGDILFYFTAMCELHGTTVEELELSNMAKLLKRYPEGYTDTAAQMRADKA